MPGILKTLFLRLVFLLLFGCAQPKDPKQLDAFPASSPAGRFDVAIYSGPGSWMAEAGSLKSILYAHGATYEDVTAGMLNRFSAADYARYSLIIFPGGDAPTVLALLSPETRARIREAVQLGGLNYLGFCAGAWMAVGPAPEPGGSVGYGLGVATGPYLEKNFLGKRELAFALDRARFPGGLRRRLLWYGGPITPDISGSVIARYSDGTPAISQVFSGRGLVIVSGLHPAATDRILAYLGFPGGEAIAPDLAWALLEAGIHRTPLPAFP